jgi:hypothetical protein
MLQPGNSDRFLMTFELEGAEPDQTYTVGFDVFGLPDPGLTSFGVPRFVRITQTREGVTATTDVYPVTTFSTDANGDGKASVSPPLDLEGVPPGDYDLQFWWSRGGQFPVYYRTGGTFGVGFGVLSL